LHPKPPHLDFQQAAALPLAGLTAYRSIHKRAAVRAGENVLIHGIGGGVALFALQFALLAGAQVAVTSTAEAKLARSLELGAALGINSRNQDWTAETLAWTSGRGVDVVIDSIGGEMFANSLSVVRPGGRIVTYGTSAHPHAEIDLETLFWHQLNLLGSTMGSPQDFSDMLDLVNQKTLEPIIDSVWPLSQGQAALQHLADGRQFGKVVLTCS
jgi:NADPH:quinone reductase-like Zn-dependent oxidoreductase